jgi:tRNA(Arg) A34 adenosine deaminase TadA
MKNHLDGFEVARKAAGKTDPIITRYLHASVLLDRRGKIIAVGRNHFAGGQVDTGDGIIDKSMHSEIDALRKVNIRRLNGAVIINYARTNVASNLARPCPNCWTVLKKLGLRKVFFSIRSELDIPIWVEEYF